jgi:Tfp pilus assembly protein PilX
MKVRIQRDERGAALVLAIVFMVVIGAIGGGVLASLTSGQNNGTHLVAARNREYAADAAVESSIARTRVALFGNTTSCATDSPYTFEKANPSDPGIRIHLDCFNSPVLIAGPGGTILAQNNVTFNACVFTGSGNGDSCTASSTIISASVNFQKIGAPVTQVNTYVQSWSVNA